MDTSDEWIMSRTGIKERRIADEKTSTADMAVAAAGKALEMAETGHEDIDLLLLGTVTPDYRVPSAACCVQEVMGLPNAVAMDINAACTGFISGLSMAKACIESGDYKTVLVIGVEKLSSITNYKDRNTCVLFGDAAGAAVVAPSSNGSGLLSSFLRSDGSHRELLWIPTGGSRTPLTEGFEFDGSDKLFMAGSEVFKLAVREMANASLKAIEAAGLEPDDISLVIPHQANIRIIDAIVKRLGIDRSKLVLNIEKYGNTSAASVPLALDEVNRAGRIKPGDNVLMVAFGGGMIWGASVVRW